MENVNVRPLNDRILVRRQPEEEKTAGGIIIVETAKEKPLKGQVVATGKGHRRDSGEWLELEVKTGDQVLFGKYAGTEIKIEAEDYLILREEDVLAVLN
jgi:chaperonin GroES